MSRSIRCVMMRGGTSKGVFLDERSLPGGDEERDAAILAIFGSPDSRQIDGIGGADPLTSKVCILGPPPKQGDAHLSYTFGQVGISKPQIDYQGLCGNLTAGVGAYALWERWVEAVDPITTVRIYNTNLDCILTCEVPVKNGLPLEHGNYSIPGVPRAGSRIQIDFADTAGQSAGRLLPTGNVMDVLSVPGVGEINASLVDIGNAHVFVEAERFGLYGDESAAVLNSNVERLTQLEKVRTYAGARMGLLDDPDNAIANSPAIPMVVLVAPSGNQSTELAKRCDLQARLIFMQEAHKAFAATSTVCTGVASRIAGTLVNKVTSIKEQPNVRISHPAGVSETESVIQTLSAGGYRVTRATLGRTARRLFVGEVYY